MLVTRKCAMINALFIAGLAITECVSAQLGFPVRFPSDDFYWTWGWSEVPENRRFADIDIRGNEAAFLCQLQVGFRIASGISPRDQREIESRLQASLLFIQESASIMYELDLARMLEWAVLDCDRQEAEASESELREREDRAREKAERRRERRRERE